MSELTNQQVRQFFECGRDKMPHYCPNHGNSIDGSEIVSTVEALRARLTKAEQERDQAKNDLRETLDKVAANNLEHYRQMGRETLSQIERAEAAESALAAIRAWLDASQDEPEQNGYDSAKDDVRALLSHREAGR